ncbi:NAD-dependent epimerase/dehydratase family protein [Flavihumibacter sp. UBA7668]|uniref:NAD-dependent epimerase/dehydratase family protein n=1 Tax=Flavihumibacter sp. UBA7668 TaxID=1946542 RepID=UPI0025C6BFC4|nr:NAD-dependent epimerase/dehydratase family protein [Flavihumibacter sp. UBA7668]
MSGQFTELEQWEKRLLAPSPALTEDLKTISGDIMLLGVGGKMGPSMAKLAIQAIAEAGISKRVIGVSRFSESGLKQELEAAGVETIAADLLDDDALKGLPQVENIIYLAGQKFGTTGREGFTWAMNTYLPGRVAEKFKNSKIVAFSTGNVYPFAPVYKGGLDETVTPAPVGEYGQSCLGRERIFQYFAEKNGTPTLIYRLNYAVDFRYGVVLEIAKSVWEGKAIDLSSGNVNVIWQGDANEIAIRSLLHCSSPARILNVTGPELLSVQWIAEQFGRKFDKQPVFISQPEPTALLSNASACNQLFGYPRTTIRDIIDITSEWVKQGGDTFGKATHFQERNGQF